jgi:formate dehydrogenase major subunit
VNKPDIHPYNKPAGGWGALKATIDVLLQQGIAVKGGQTLFKMNQPAGFDCPGCAWPDPSGSFPLKFCENGAKAMAWEATSNRVTSDFFAQHTVSWLAEQSDYWLEEQGRLTHPMVYDEASDKYVPIEWGDAFALIGQELRSLDDPNQAEFYTSGRASNEAAFLFQLFGREYGTNNFPDCSNMCHEATSVGLPPAIGVAKGTVLLEDFAHTDAIFILGQNPGTSSPRMMDELHAAARRGVPIVTFNPLRERALERFADPKNVVEMATLGATPISSNYYQVRIGGDAVALKGIMKALIESDDAASAASAPRTIDVEFIETHTHGFEALADDLRVTSWDIVEQQSGLKREDLVRAAAIYANAKAVIGVWGMGITQHRHGTETVQQIINLLLLRGNIGRPGAGACPVRGHSNVQGNRTVGITEKPSAEFLDQLRDTFGFEPPRAHGHDVVTSIDAMVHGRSKVFIALGGNFVAATPDAKITQDAMRRLNLTVGINTKLNRGHVVHGRKALILPCLGRTEIDIQADGPQSITVEDSMSMVHASAGSNEPASPHLRSEAAIVAGIAQAALPHSRVAWAQMIENYDRIRDGIEAVFPIFEHFNARIRVPGGFHLTSSARERLWETPTGRANFMIFKGVVEDPCVDDPDAVWLTSIRSHDQYNTTIYSLNDRYRGVFGQRRVIFLSARDMRKRGLKAGEWVDLRTISDDGVDRVACGFKIVPYRLPEGSCAAYYPETNGLVPLHSHDPKSRTPAYKAIPIKITRSKPSSPNT